MSTRLTVLDRLDALVPSKPNLHVDKDKLKNFRDSTETTLNKAAQSQFDKLVKSFCPMAYRDYYSKNITQADTKGKKTTDEKVNQIRRSFLNLEATEITDLYTKAKEKGDLPLALEYARLMPDNPKSAVLEPKTYDRSRAIQLISYEYMKRGKVGEAEKLLNLIEHPMVHGNAMVDIVEGHLNANSFPKALDTVKLYTSTSPDDKMYKSIAYTKILVKYLQSKLYTKAEDVANIMKTEKLYLHTGNIDLLTIKERKAKDILDPLREDNRL